MLAELVELAHRLAEDKDKQSVPAEYLIKPVKWLCSVDATSGSAQMISTRDERGRGYEVAIPVLRRSGTKVKPQLLADRADFVFGGELAKPGATQAREFRALVEACAQATGSAAVAAVHTFLTSSPPDFSLPPDIGEKDNVTFIVDGQRVVDRSDVAMFWERLAPRLRARGLPELSASLVLSMLEVEEEERGGQCLVCGEHRQIARTHPVPLRFPRAVADQAVSLVSANEDAFYSYGLEQSHVGPTCLPCARDYGRALRHLINEPSTHLTVGSVLFVFWVREPQAGFDIRTFFDDPDPGEVKTLLDSVRSGRKRAPVDEAAFYAASFSASGGRAVVRDWIDTTVTGVAENVARWFELQRIISPRAEDPSGENPRPLSLFQLAASTVRDVRRDLPATTPRTLFRSALTGTPLPLELAYQAVRRCRAKPQGESWWDAYRRAALIKLVLLSQKSEPPPEDYMVALEPEHPDPAYHCGRLLAVIEDVQRAALPGVNATIVDRYYGAASSTPAVVFGALLRGAQPHLAELERDRRGAYVNLQRRLEEVCTRIGEWPTTLPLKDQALFSLGYYHQRARDRAEAMSRRAARDEDHSDGSTGDTTKEN